MTDHIVVFDGTDRLIGRSVRVTIDDASPFTLYGRVLTDEVVGVTAGREPEAIAPPPATRFSLPLV